ncbi:GGDEF domain-containing protein [Oscillospiraceae bacterium OttesenSCG-928-G22]|nr:GGDEF domain-containing protein [Oscillospiraceae bacterium OttesenSCG-928-G22]
MAERKDKTYESIAKISQWNRRAILLKWGFLLILFCCELVNALVYIAVGVTMGTSFEPFEYVRNFLIVPTVATFLWLTFFTALYNRVIVKMRQTSQAYLVLASMLVIVSVVVYVHHGINVIPALYAVPIVLSILYVDKKVLLFTFCFSIAFYQLAYVLIRRFVSPEYYTHTYMDVLGTIALLGAVYLIARLILLRISDLIHTAVELNIAHGELSRELKLDPFTGLYNHATFYERLDAAILQHRDEGTNFSLVIMDIDDFKRINDTFGHDVGDVVILRLVSLLNEEIGPTDTAFRYGGEEFILIVRGSADRAIRTAEQIRSRFGAQVYKELPSHMVTVSAGVALYDATYGGRREFFSAVDKALYTAKSLGKNRVEVARQSEEKRPQFFA